MSVRLQDRSIRSTTASTAKESRTTRRSPSSSCRPSVGARLSFDREYDHEWLPADEVVRRMTYPNEARVVEQTVLGVETEAVEATYC